MKKKLDIDFHPNRNTNIMRIIVGVDPLPDQWHIGSGCKRGHGYGGKSVRNYNHQCIECCRHHQRVIRRAIQPRSFAIDIEKEKDRREQESFESPESYYDDLLD